MSNQMIATYLQTLESNEIVKFNGFGYKVTGIDAVIEFGEDGFEIDGRPATVASIKNLVRRAFGKPEIAESTAPNTPAAIKNQPGIFRLIGIRGLDVPEAPQSEEVLAIAASGQYQPATLPVVRQKVGPQGITYEVLEGHEVLAIAKAVKTANPRVETVPAWVMEISKCMK